MGVEIPAFVLSNIICLAVLTILCYQSSKQYRILTEERLFLEVMLGTIIMIICDTIWYLVQGKTGTLLRVVDVIVCGSYLFIAPVITFILLVYIDYKYCRRAAHEFNKRVIFYSIPLAVFLLLITPSQFTGWLFYVDENNVYRRGPLHFIQFLFAACYVIYGAILAVRSTKKLITKSQKKEVVSLAVFAIASLLGGVLQNVITEVPILCISMTVSILFVYLNVQSKQIYIDTLTGINNRRQFNIYIDSVLKGKKRKSDVYLLMMDIDKFKKINDAYGHIEGDYALVTVSEILSKVCSEHDDFVARYGGDEFAVVCLRKSDEEVEKLKIKIREEINISNKLSDRSYDISLSIGSAKLFVDMDTQESAIMKADEQLYLIKAQREQ